MRSANKFSIVALCFATLCIMAAPGRANVRSQALYARGLIPFNAGLWDQAYLLFNEAVQSDGADALALYYRGLTQARRRQGALAIQDIEKALEIDPNLPHATLDLGILYFDAGQFAQAKPWLEKAYTQGTERHTAAFFLGVALYRLGDYAAAQQYLNEAKADPELRQAAQYYTGLSLLRQEQEAAARAEFAAAAQEQPDSDIGKLSERYLSGGAAPPGAPLQGKPQKLWSVYANLGLEYDSNVVIGPSDDPNSAITRESDGRTVLGAGAAYTLLDSDVISLDAEYDFYQSIHFQLNEFDLQGHRVQLAAQSAPNVFNYGMTGAYDFYALNYQTFYQDLLATPWVAFAEGKSAATQVYYGFRYRDFFRAPYDPYRDGYNNAFGARQYLALGRPDRVLSFGYQFDLETPEDADSSNPLIKTGARDFEYHASQIDVGLAFPILDSTRGQVGYLGRLEDYEFPNSRANFDKRRHDNQHQFAVAAEHDLTENVALTFAFIGVFNYSNISEFEYNRQIVSGGARVRF